MLETPHQERSQNTLQNMDVLIQLYTKNEAEKIRATVARQMERLGMWQVQNYLEAKKDKKQGGEGIMHSVTFDN